MKVGFHVGQVVFRGADLQQQWSDQLEQFRLTRDVGFDFISWGQHWLIDPFQHFQPIPVLSRFAAEANGMELVTGVLLLPMLNPVHVAEELATIDHICQGRLICGLGLGYRPEEFEIAGLEMSERAARFEEGLRLIKRLWTEDEVNHEGRFYSVSNARPTLRPYQKPHPRIWVAAMNDAPVRRAARHGHPFFALGLETLPEFARHMEIWRETLKGLGVSEPQEVPILREVFIGRTREEARERARKSVEAKYKGYAQHGLPLAGEAIDRGIEGLLEDPFVIGTPEECVEKLARYGELGVTHMDLRLFWPAMEQREVLEMIEIAGQSVLPELKRL